MLYLPKESKNPIVHVEHFHKQLITAVGYAKYTLYTIILLYYIRIKKIFCNILHLTHVQNFVSGDIKLLTPRCS